MNRREFTKAAVGGSIIGLSALAGCTTEDEPSDSDTGNGAPQTGSGGTAQNDQQTKDGSEKKTKKDKKKDLRLLDHEFYTEGDVVETAGVRGTAINETGDTLSYVGIEIIFLNDEKTQIGTTLDNTTDLKDGRKWKFDAMFLGDDPSNVGSYEIEISDSPF